MGQKVLLADDSITVQKIVKLSLHEEGIEVIAFGNGSQAIAEIENIRPDLIMADVFMPGKDGYEVCEFVKSHPQFKNIPVILLVHAFEPFDPDRAKKVGADHQLTKPFQSIRTLVTTVKDLLQSQETAQTQTPPLETLNQPSPLSASVATFPPSSAHTQFGEVSPTIPVLATATSFQSETVSETAGFPSFPPHPPQLFHLYRRNLFRCRNQVFLFH